MKLTPPEQYIEALRSRLAQHEGCSRFGPKDSFLLSKNLKSQIQSAIAKAKRVLAADESDYDMRVALLRLLEALGEGELPNCICDDHVKPVRHRHKKVCPLHAWEEKA